MEKIYILGEINSRLDNGEGCISNMEDKVMKITQIKHVEKNNFKKKRFLFLFYLSKKLIN